MGNATKVALVALLILLVVVIAKLVKDDSDGPLADSHAAVEGRTEPADEADVPDGQLAKAVPSGNPAKKEKSKGAGLIPVAGDRNAVKRAEPGGRARKSPALPPARPTLAKPAGAGVVQRSANVPRKNQPLVGSSTGRAGPNDPRQSRLGGGAKTAAGGVGAKPKSVGGTHGRPSGSDVAAAGRYRPELPGRTLPAPRPRVGGDRGALGVIAGTGTRVREPAKAIDGAGISPSSGAAVEPSRREIPKKKEEKLGFKPPPPPPSSVREKGAKKSPNYEADRLRGGMDAEPIVKSGEKVGVVPVKKLRKNPAPRSGKSLSGAQHQYVIRENDSLWRIAERYYGKGSLWPLLEKANPGVKIRPGNVLVVPPRPAEPRVRASQNPPSRPRDGASDLLARGAVKSSKKNKTTGEYELYLVQRGDTLSGIAKKFYGDGRKYPVLEKANQGIRPQLLRAGDQIRVPVLQK